jgi:hypothetical protein
VARSPPVVVLLVVTSPLPVFYLAAASSRLCRRTFGRIVASPSQVKAQIAPCHRSSRFLDPTPAPYWISPHPATLVVRIGPNPALDTQIVHDQWQIQNVRQCVGQQPSFKIGGPALYSSTGGRLAVNPFLITLSKKKNVQLAPPDPHQGRIQELLVGFIFSFLIVHRAIWRSPRQISGLNFFV